MTRTYNLPFGSTTRDIPGNGKEEPCCEHSNCFELLDGDEEIRMGLCARHLRQYQEEIEP